MNLTAKQKGLKRGGSLASGNATIQKQLTVLRRTASTTSGTTGNTTPPSTVAEQNDVVVEPKSKMSHLNPPDETLRPGHPGKPRHQRQGQVTASTGAGRPGARPRLSLQAGKLERHCEKTGTWFLKVDPRYTSQTCSNCGYRPRRTSPEQPQEPSGIPVPPLPDGTSLRRERQPSTWKEGEDNSCCSTSHALHAERGPSGNQGPPAGGNTAVKRQSRAHTDPGWQDSVACNTVLLAFSPTARSPSRQNQSRR